MTKAGAIKELKLMLMDNSNTGAMYNALKMGIEALEALPNTNNTLECVELDNNSTKVDNENVDLIRRQDAIDVAKQHWYKPDIAKALEELPSVQAEQEILDELMDIMKDYYFTHRYEYDEAWENGFMKSMNLIPNVYMKRGKDR